MLRAQADTMPSTPDQWMLPEDIAYCVLFLLKYSEKRFFSFSGLKTAVVNLAHKLI